VVQPYRTTFKSTKQLVEKLFKKRGLGILDAFGAGGGQVQLMDLSS
jgi:hypothetical protein